MWSIRTIWLAVMRAIRNCCRWIFFTKPLLHTQHRGLRYHHLERFYKYALCCFGFFHLVPWIMHGSWYLLATSGCSWDRSRFYLEAICIQPYRDPGNQTPWYLDLWLGTLGTPDPGTPDPESPSAPIEIVMTGYLNICDGGSVLQDQILKIKDISSGPSPGELLDSLSQSPLSP